MVGSERTSREWFAEATQCYVERHQGCAWCGGSYRVFRQQQGPKTEYYCSGCDFRTGHDAETDAYFAFPGLDRREKSPETMFDFDPRDFNP
jgi:hypothetical protein